MKITGTVVGTESVASRFLSLRPRIKAQVSETVRRLTIGLQAHVKADKLSGQVLKNRTGTLRRSINSRITDSGESVIGSVGTNISYARIHEYGFNGTVTVREHLRKTQSGRMATVRAHSMRMNIPKRSFLRSALDDMRPAILAGIEQSLHGVKL